MTSSAGCDRFPKHALRCVVGIACLLASKAVPGQTVPDGSLGAALGSLAARAAVVFAGEVISVRPQASWVEIQFRVDRALLGSPGAVYTLREWNGLWAAGQPRFWVGERATVFLSAASSAGLASPVDGLDGVLPTVPGGAGNEPLADIRRLATRILRPVGLPLPTSEGGAIPLSELAGAIAPPGPRPRVHEPARQPLPRGYEQLPLAPVPAALVPLRQVDGGRSVAGQQPFPNRLADSSPLAVQLRTGEGR